VISLFSVLPSSISFAMYGLDAVSIMWITIAVIVTIGLFILLIFKSEQIVSILDLDKGFDEEKIEIYNLNSNYIFKLEILITGAILILDNIPSFLSHLFFAFKSNLIGMEYESKQKFLFAVSITKIIIGYLLFTITTLLQKDFRSEKLTTSKMSNMPIALSQIRDETRQSSLRSH
jgi:hypothetical protein